MNNYALNCKRHFLAMFHGRAAPEEGRMRRHALRSTGQISLWHWEAGLSLLGKSRTDSPSTQAGHARSSHASEVHSSAAAERANEGIKKTI